MRPDDIETIRQFVHARSGVVIDPTKTYSIETRLAPVARREGFASIDDLIAAIRDRREDRLIWADGRTLTGWGHYHERYRRTPEGWRIAEQKLTRLFMEFTEPTQPVQ